MASPPRQYEPRPCLHGISVLDHISSFLCFFHCCLCRPGGLRSKRQRSDSVKKTFFEVFFFFPLKRSKDHQFQNPTFKTPICSTTSLILGSIYICIAAIDREVETKITFVKFHLTELLNIVHVQMQFFFAYFPISVEIWQNRTFCHFHRKKMRV